MRFVRTMLMVLAVLALAPPTAVRADARAIVERLTDGNADRSAGTDRARNNAAELAEQFERTTGQKVYHQQFPMTLPVVEECRSNDAEGLEVPLWLLLPSGGQLAALPGGKLTAPVIYAGKGSLAELRGHDIARRFVALDIDSPATNWQIAASLGARGIIFLGGDRLRNTELMEKNTSVPIGVPRLYCDDARTVERLRTGYSGPLSIVIQAHWEERLVDNLVCVIPGRGRATANSRWTDQLVILQARYDGSSQILGRAPGATQAANAAALIDLAGKIAASPEHCSVVIVLTAGDEWNFKGTRAFLDLLGRELPTQTAASLRITRDIAALRVKVDAAARSIGGLIQIADGHFASLQSADFRALLEDEFAIQSSQLEVDLDRARMAGDDGEIHSIGDRKRRLLTASVILSNAANARPEDQQLVRETAAALLPRWNQQLQRTSAELDALRNWSDIRAAIGPRSPLLWMSLALTSDSDRYGFFSRSAYAEKLNHAGHMAAFLQSFKNYSANDPNFTLGSLEPMYTLESFFSLPLGFSSDAALARGQAAGALATIADPAPAFDTPLDTAGTLNWDNLGSQQRSIEHLLLGGPGAPGMLTDPLFYVRTEIPLQTADQSLTLFERTAAETLPHIGAPHTLIGGEALDGTHPLGPALAGTRRIDWYLTDVQGNVTLNSALRFATTRLQSFAFDDSGLPTRTLIANQSDVRGLAGSFSPDPSRPIRAMLFDCRRLDVFNLFDPRHLDTLDRLEILDARRLDTAQFSNIYLDEHLAAAFFPPGIPWQLLGGKGSVGTRLVLINASDEHPRGWGFATTDLAELGPLQWRSALDLYALDAQRKTDLEKFGISNEVIKELQAKSEPHLKAGAQAAQSHDHLQSFASADALWSLQQEVHDNLIDTSDGIIRGVIFLLLGIIPFSFFLERLVVGSTNVYRQIIWFSIIFAAMTAGLWFHPAFRISTMPMMILLAFLILILSVTVIYILWGKFEEQIAQLRGPGALAHMTSLRRGAVFGAAVRLGLSNMRRRGTRTALTLATLVILTFTLLCFTSVRESVQVSPREILLPAQPPPGILIRRRAWQELPAETLRFAQEIAEGSPIAARWAYLSSRPEQAWSLPVRANRTFYANALLGLEPSESQFQAAPIDEILPNFSTIAQNPNQCWLPAKIRDEVTLAFKTGDTIDLLGHHLTIAGFFDPQSFLKLRQLTGDSLAPPDPSAIAAQPGGANRDIRTTASEPSYRAMPPDAVVVIPAALARELGAKLTSIVIAPPKEIPSEKLGTFAHELAQRCDFTLFVSDGSKTLAINAATSTEPKDLSTVMVPMIIAGVIVLNTMLGAVGERTREIHVYTSVGLAPAHVGMLFLAEAAALGTLGIVFGYIFGQGLATVLSWTSLLPGVDLNYSSMSAIITMSLVLGVVMISALWPAHAATRLAAPSLQREWKLPKPVGDVLSVNLPFTVNESAAKGVCAFIEEFLIATTQSGTGHFTADQEQAFLDDTSFGPVRGIVARIWLAPYDLGVIQNMELAIHPTGEHNVFDVHLQLTREAGNPAAWYRLNRPFLTEIRKQFLLWRNLDAAATQNYLARADKMFDKTQTAQGATRHEDKK